MNNEIINKLKYISNNPIINGEYDEENYLYDKEAQQLLDYITNLEQENEKLNEQIKKDNHILGCNFAQKNKYKSRIDKAIEYIKAVGVRPKEIDSFVLLNILTGGDEE